MTVRAAPPPRLIRLFPARFIARATGANVRTAERWRGGQSPQARFRDRIGELQAVLDMLGRGMTDRRQARLARGAERARSAGGGRSTAWPPVTSMPSAQPHESYVVGDYV